MLLLAGPISVVGVRRGATAHHGRSLITGFSHRIRVSLICEAQLKWSVSVVCVYCTFLALAKFPIDDSCFWAHRRCWVR